MTLRRLWVIVLGLSLTLSACSLAQDVTPPPGVPVSVQSAPGNADPPAAAPADSGRGYPAAPPSTAQGATIFAQHCAACHGVTGKGDGPVAGQLMQQRTNPLPDLSTPNHLLYQSPFELFQIITQGRLEKLMPPWANKLTEAERWSVVAYLYTLGAPPTQREAGQALYAAQCAACHGETGRGDGAEAQDLAPANFTDQSFMAARNDKDLFTALANHKVPLPESLTDDERWAVMGYLRMLSFDAIEAPVAVAPVMAESKGTVSGRVTNGTRGAFIPAELPIVLRGFDNFIEVQTFASTVPSDGAFEFADVPTIPGRQFMLTAEHAGLTYSSDIFNFDSTTQVNELALTIYDTTADPVVLQIERMHIVFDFNAGPGHVGVGEMVLISNLSDKTFARPNGSSFEMPLPAGAAGLAVQNLREGVDYTRTVDGVAFNRPIRPGPSAAQLTLFFQLPYADALKFEQRIGYPINALNVLVPENGVTAQGASLRNGGAQTIQGATFRAYDATGIKANEAIVFQVAGQPGAASVASSTAAFDPIGLMASLLAAGLALTGVGVWWYWRQSTRQTAAPHDMDSLIQTIADLDDAFEDGAIEKRRYERERSRLKTQLTDLTEARQIE